MKNAGCCPGVDFTSNQALPAWLEGVAGPAVQQFFQVARSVQHIQPPVAVATRKQGGSIWCFRRDCYWLFVDFGLRSVY